MLKENTRKAIEIDLIMALKHPQEKEEDVLMVKTARKIFHTETEWSNNDIETMCKFIRENGTDSMSCPIRENGICKMYWPNNTGFIFYQIIQMISKASDYQIVIWLKGIWGADKALDYIISCEQEF